jgi:23S rRNA (cytidine1920-2'-O)/16S rRNA (cytidine1409-2'-O)-methyltransferase
VAARAEGKERLDALLVERGLAQSREQARARILAGEVVVDEHRVDKPGTRVRRDARLRLKGESLPFVSRGGLKLAHALRAFALDVRGKVALDVGASTGGFTDVLVQAGAERVYAVDVGYGQMAHSLRQDPRVVVMERTHVKALQPFNPQPTFCCIDVSFISLRLVLPHVMRLLPTGADVVALVKPQFEVGRGNVGKGGIVRSAEARQEALNSVLGAARQLGWIERATDTSPLLGQKGNQEFLVHWVTPGEAPSGMRHQDMRRGVGS